MHTRLGLGEAVTGPSGAYPRVAGDPQNRPQARRTGPDRRVRPIFCTYEAGANLAPRRPRRVVSTPLSGRSRVGQVVAYETSKTTARFKTEWRDLYGNKTETTRKFTLVATDFDAIEIRIVAHALENEDNG